MKNHLRRKRGVNHTPIYHLKRAKLPAVGITGANPHLTSKHPHFIPANVHESRECKSVGAAALVTSHEMPMKPPAPTPSQASTD
jgi:hypothetical protein